MNRFGHGGRQKRLIIGQVRVKVENLSAARPLESIVRKVSCDIPAGRGERLSKKKGKKKGDARDKKTGFRLEIKLFIVSPFRGHCGETINGNKIRLIARKSSPVRRFRFISDDDLTRFQNLFRISPFFFPSFFFIFNFFFSFFFFYYTTSSGVDRKYSVQPGERLSQACSFPNLFHWEWFGFGVDTKWRVEDAPYLGDKRGVI